MTAAYYILTVLFSAVQSVFAKKNGKENGDIKLFQLARAAVALASFGIIIILSGKLHLDSALYGSFYGVSLSLSMVSGYMALKNGPMGLTSSVVSFSLIIPIIFSAITLGERLTTFGICGLILCFISIIFLNIGKKNDRGRISNVWWLYTFITLLTNGVCSILQKLHGKAYGTEGKPDFMFFSSLVCTAIFLIIFIFGSKKEMHNIKATLKNGILTGIGNGAAGLFTLFLATNVNSGVLFPIISVSTILASLACGGIFFAEKLSKNQFIGFLVSITAIIFLQM